MSETSDKPASVELNSKKDTLSYYASLLGLDQRRYPKKEEMPPYVFLPPEVLGNFKENILATSRDGLERSQLVGWDFLTHKPRNTQVILGNENDTGQKDTMRSNLMAYFGPKSLIHTHTHPKTDQSMNTSWIFSPVDLAVDAALPRLAYIRAVGSNMGASFIFQAEGAQRLPKNTAEVSEEVENYIKKNWVYTKIAKYLADRNLILYRWSPVGGGLEGEMIKKGMWLNKVEF